MGRVVRLREIRPDDWEIMRDLRLEALGESPGGFRSTYAREVTFAEDQWRGRINHCNVTYVAYQAEEPVGLAGVHEEDGVPDLVSMWVRPSARGQKIGETLVTACADWTRDHGHGELFLWVAEANPGARRLYERCGFVPTGTRDLIRRGDSHWAIQMRLPLTG